MGLYSSLEVNHHHLSSILAAGGGEDKGVVKSGSGLGAGDGVLGVSDKGEVGGDDDCSCMITGGGVASRGTGRAMGLARPGVKGRIEIAGDGEEGQDTGEIDRSYSMGGGGVASLGTGRRIGSTIGLARPGV